MARTDTATAVRRAELLAALSLAIDLGLGQPMEHVMRSTLIATRLARAIGLKADAQAKLFYANLIAWIGCTADSQDLGGQFGDDVAFRRDIYYSHDRADPGFGRAVIAHVGRGDPFLRRLARVASFVGTSGEPARDLIRSHCLSAAVFATRLGLPAAVGDLLGQLFERWDGRGFPAGLRGEDIAIEMRIVHVADIAEVHHRIGGVERALAVARARRGTKFDPRLVEALCGAASTIFAELEESDVWRRVIETAPDRGTTLGAAELEAVLVAIADFADLKSAYRAGHSRGVATLAAAAARALGLSSVETEEVRRAAFVHDLGRVGIPTALWDRRGPLSSAEWERVRLYPYLTERILSHASALERLAQVAGRQHEQLDGHGYPHGLRAPGIDVRSRLLAAADRYHAMCEARAHRPALGPERCAAELRQAARAGQLDGQVVDAVLRAAGHAPSEPRSAGLTQREAQIVRAIATGQPTRTVAASLGIAEKTLRNHIEHIYSKLGVRNRTALILAAVDRGIAGPFPDPLAEERADPRNV